MDLYAKQYSFNLFRAKRSARRCTRVRFHALQFARENVPLCIVARKRFARKRSATCWQFKSRRRFSRGLRSATSRSVDGSWPWDGRGLWGASSQPRSKTASDRQRKIDARIQSHLTSWARDRQTDGQTDRDPTTTPLMLLFTESRYLVSILPSVANKPRSLCAKKRVIFVCNVM